MSGQPFRTLQGNNVTQIEWWQVHLSRWSSHFQVGWLKAKDQTILALHHRVITHNNRFDVDHDENRIWKLKIRSVQESDAGCYMCQINTEVMKKQVGCIDVLSKTVRKCSWFRILKILSLVFSSSPWNWWLENELWCACERERWSFTGMPCQWPSKAGYKMATRRQGQLYGLRQK